MSLLCLMLSPQTNERKRTNANAQVSRLQIGMENAVAGRSAFAGQPPPAQLSATLKEALASFSVSAAAKERALLLLPVAGAAGPAAPPAGAVGLWRLTPPL